MQELPASLLEPYPQVNSGLAGGLPPRQIAESEVKLAAAR